MHTKNSSQKLTGEVQMFRLRVAAAESKLKVLKEQKRRFEARITDPVRQWKLSPMDLPSRTKWFEYSRARDQMLQATDTKHAPWYILRSNDKKRARLNCITHLLNLIPYKKVPREKIELPERSMKGSYDDEATLKGRKFIAEKY